MGTEGLVDIYTDGACRGNPGPGGWAALLIFSGREKELAGAEALTTNNRMELTAVSSMRLLVVSLSAPASSFSRPAKLSNAAQPPGPGLPRQAPSV